MADGAVNQEYDAISAELRDMKERINQLATAIGQDVRVLQERNLKDLTLTGLANNYASVKIAATDTGIQALGKLQKQIDTISSDTPDIDYTQALSVPLTGLVFDDQGKIVATDTVLEAFGKLQGQLNDIDPVNEWLTGFTVAAEVDTIRATDSTLTAFGKVQAHLNQIDADLANDIIHAILTPFVEATDFDDVNNTDSILTAIQKLSYTASDAYWKAIYVEDNYTAASMHEIWWDDNANDKTRAGVFYASEDWRGETSRNFPTELAGVMLVTKHPDYPQITQEYTAYSNRNKWVRTYTGTAWTAWVRF